MPIYEYRCECGARFESLERMSELRSSCGDLCPLVPPRGDGAVERIFAPSHLRGTGQEAAEPTIDIRKRARRPWDDCC